MDATSDTKSNEGFNPFAFSEPLAKHTMLFNYYQLKIIRLISEDIPVPKSLDEAIVYIEKLRPMCITPPD